MERLDNVVQPYGWGDLRAIWELLGVEPPGTPAAELWMGTHPQAPSRLAGRDLELGQLIDRDPVAALGAEVAGRFGGRLPFLFKVLAAGRALSVQAHPNPELARAGYDREEAAGIARDHPDRTYRDAFHKPELICAVTPFQARCGFRPRAETLELLDDLGVAALEPLRRTLAAGSDERAALADALRWLLTLPAGPAAALVEAAAASAARPGPRRSGAERFEAERCWTVRLAEQHPGDPGVLVALLLNHVVLQPGEALFLGAGNLHCYLEGVGVEIMANSDNVVRGGLTSKHVDVDELLSVVDPVPLPVVPERPSGPVHTYASPVGEFALTRLELSAAGVDRPAAARIVLVLEGRARLEAGAGVLELVRGQSAWVSAADGPVRMSGSGLVYDATTGRN